MQLECLQGTEGPRICKNLLFSADGLRGLCSPFDQWCPRVLPCIEKAKGGTMWFVPSLPSSRRTLWKVSTVLKLILLIQHLEEEMSFWNICKALKIVISRWNVRKFNTFWLTSKHQYKHMSIYILKDKNSLLTSWKSIASEYKHRIPL